MRIKLFFIFLFASILGWGQFNINEGSTDYTQNFNSLTSGTWANNTTLTGWYARTTLTANITTYLENTGSTTTAGLYSFGSTSSTERAFGFATTNAFTGSAGTGKNFMGWRLKNNTGSKITSITVTWTGEQWRRESNTATQDLTLSYQISTTVTDLLSGTWTPTSSKFTSPNVGTTAAALDGNLAANRTAGISITIEVEIEPDEEIMLRWEDLNDSGNDHILAIDDVTVRVEVENSCSSEIPTGDITGSSSACNSSVLSFSGTAPSGEIYYWQSSETGVDDTYNASSNLTVTSSGTYFVRAYNVDEECWSKATSGFNVTITTSNPSINTQPANTSVIEGNAANFSVSATDAVSYQWQVNTGSGFNDISGATSATYNTGTTTMSMSGYQYRVVVTNTCGNTTSNVATLTVTAGLENDNCSGAIPLTVNAPATSGTLVGSTYQSPFNRNDVWYSFTPSCTGQLVITLNGFSTADLVFDIWANNCPTMTTGMVVHQDGSGAGGSETHSSYTYTSGTTYYIRVSKYYTSDPDVSFNIQITSPNLGTPTSITASPATFCAGAFVTFTATTVTNATSYSWEVPSDWTITGTSANTMTATVGSIAGLVKVKAVNCYGEGVQKSVNFTPGVIPSTPDSITGNTEVCENSTNTYSVSSVTGATSYTWTLPTGWTGTSTTNSITVTSNGTGGTISVTANSSCGSSAPQTLAVTVSPKPSTPPTPTTNSPQCLPTGVTISYGGTTPTGETWYWQTTATGTDTGSINSAPTYTVTTPGVSTVYLRSKNDVTGCWSDASSTTVTVNDITSITTQPQSQSVTAGSQATFSVTAVGGSLTYQWQVSTDGGSNWTNVTGGSGANTATYTTVNATEAMDGYKYRVQITGACGNITSDGLATLNVVEIVYAHGDFRSFSDGTWTNNTTPGTARWEKYSTVTNSWTLQPVGTEPSGSSDAYTVYISHNIEVPSTGVSQLATAKLHILNGGYLLYKFTSNQWTFRNIIIENGGTLDMVGRFTVLSTGEFEIKDGGTFIHNYPSNPASTSGYFWNGKEKFHPESNFIVKNHPTSSSSYFLPAESNLTANTFNGITAYFGNLIFEVPARISNGNLSSTSTYLTHGNLEFNNTSNLSMFYSNGTWNIGKDLKINPSSTGSVSITTSAVNVSMTVRGNFIGNGYGAFRLVNNTDGNVTLNIDGNIQIYNGTMDLSNQNGGTSIINLIGDLIVSNIGKLLVTPATGANTFTSNFNFTGTGDGLTPETTQTIDVVNQSTASNITFNVNNGAFVKVINQNLSLGSNSKFNVLTGGSLDFGFAETTALNILGGTGTSFTQQPDSDLYITSPNGIQTTGALGNVQTVTRTFATASPYADFHYVGNSPQETGTALPENVRDITIQNTSATNQVTLTNAASNLNIFRNLDIQQGIFNLNDKNVAGSGGNANMNIETPGTLKIVGTKNFPIGFNPIIFKNSSTVEYGGATQTVAVTGMTNYSNLPAYENLVISGSEIKSAGDKNLVVNQITKVNSSTLRIPETAEDEEPYVLTAKNGIDVASTATLLLENNANLMQDPGVVNTGNIHLKRKAVVPKIQYNFWSSPVIQQVLYQLYPGIPNNKVMVYNTETDFFKVLTYSSNPKSEFGKGYSIKGSALDEHQPNVEATFIGTPNNQSSISGPDLIPLSIAKQQYNLIGNPYPSNLDLVSVYNHPDNEEVFNQDEPSAYFWDNTDNTDLNQQGEDYVNQNYAILNLPSGVGTSAPRFEESEGKRPNGIVRPGQGFIVRANPGHENPQIKLYNTMRTTSITSGGSISTYFKGSQPSFEDTYENTDLDTAEPNYFYLGMSTPNDLHLEIAIGYFDGANLAKEKFDSEIMSESASDNFYSFSSDNFKLGIQGRPAPFDAKDIIQLGSKHYQPGRYTIYLKDRYGLFRNQKIYIKDRKANTIHDLTVAPFTFFTEHSELSDRYQIIFKTSTKVKASENPQLINKVEISKKDGNIVVESTIDKIVEVELVNISGTTIYKNSSINQKDWKISENKFNKQIVVVKVITEKGDIVTKKLINQ